MTDCLDSDTLANVCAAVAWDGEGFVSHVASCEECRARMRLLDSLHGVIAEEMPVPAELAAGILDALRAEARDAPASLWPAGGGERWRVAALVLPLASAAAFVLLTLIVQQRVSEDAPLAFDLAASILLGLLGAAWAWRDLPAGGSSAGALTRLA